MSVAPVETTWGMPARPAAVRRSGPAVRKPPDELVGKLGRRDVQHAGNQPLVDERFHRPAAIAGGVEHEHFAAGALERLAGALDARAS